MQHSELVETSSHRANKILNNRRQLDNGGGVFSFNNANEHVLKSRFNLSPPFAVQPVNSYSKWEINSIESVTESTDSAFFDCNELNMTLNKKLSNEFQPSSIESTVRQRKNSAYNLHKLELEKQLM